jgi:hypothetical protein
MTAEGTVGAPTCLCHKLEMFILQKITKSYQILPKQA